MRRYRFKQIAEARRVMDAMQSDEMLLSTVNAVAIACIDCLERIGLCRIELMSFKQ